MFGKITVPQIKGLVSNVARDISGKSSQISGNMEISAGNSVLSSEIGNATMNFVHLTVQEKNINKLIIAQVNDATGEMNIALKPLFMGTKKAIQRVRDFLERIQPQNISTAEVLKNTRTPDRNGWVHVIQKFNASGTIIKRTASFQELNRLV